MLRLYSTVTSKRTISINGEFLFRDFLSKLWAYVQIRENVASNKNLNPTNVRNQCRGEPYVRLLTETEIKPMSDGEGKP
jgi:hypothetical protein